MYTESAVAVLVVLYSSGCARAVEETEAEVSKADEAGKEEAFKDDEAGKEEAFKDDEAVPDVLERRSMVLELVTVTTSKRVVKAVSVTVWFAELDGAAELEMGPALEPETDTRKSVLEAKLEPMGVLELTGELVLR